MPPDIHLRVHYGYQSHSGQIPCCCRYTLLSISLKIADYTCHHDCRACSCYSPSPTIAYLSTPPKGLGSLDWADVAVHQALCQDVQRLKNSPSLQLITVTLRGIQLLSNVSTGCLFFLVLAFLPFNANHNFAHPGIPASCRIISCRFVQAGLRYTDSPTYTLIWWVPCHHLEDVHISSW